MVMGIARPKYSNSFCIMRLESFPNLLGHTNSADEANSLDPPKCEDADCVDRGVVVQCVAVN